MTEKDLEALRVLHMEIRSIDKAMRHPSKSQQITSDYHYEYCNGKRKVKFDTGYETENSAYKRLAEKMAKKQERMVRLIEKIEDWIDTVDDAEMRTIIRLYYCCGLTQEEVAEETEIKNQETISRKLARFWKYK